MENNILNQQYSQPKLYSYQAFALGTFVGGPMAAGIMARRNFLKLDMVKHGWAALFTGITLNILLLIYILFLSHDNTTFSYGFFYHIAYTGINTLIVWLMQGEIIAMHEQNKGEFHSLYKAGLLGISSVVSLVAILYISLYFTTAISPSTGKWLQDKLDPDIYAHPIELSLKNENEALSFYPALLEAEAEKAIIIADSIMLPLFQQNLSLLNELEAKRKYRAGRTSQLFLLQDRNRLQIEKLILIRQAAEKNEPLPGAEIENIESYIRSITLHLEKLEPIINDE